MKAVATVARFDRRRGPRTAAERDEWLRSRQEARAARHEARRAASVESLCELPTAQEVAEVLGVAVSTVRTMCRAGRLVEVRCGRLQRITRESVLALVGK